MLAHSSSCRSLMPVLVASALRPLTVRAASSSASVVRIPSDLSLEAEKAVMPSSSEIGYVMVSDLKNASDELAKPRCSGDDLAHPLRSDFVAPKSEKFTGDVLDVTDAKTKTHQSGTYRHQAAAHQFADTALLVRRRDCRFCTRDLIDQHLDFFGRTAVSEEVQHNADGFFGDSFLHAGLRRQQRNQLVHNKPRLRPVAYRFLPRDFILSFAATNYKRSPHSKARFTFIRFASVAAMQELS